jgi:hypothetical protein
MTAGVYEEQAQLTPASGFNLVGCDTFSVPGEALFLVSHHTTELEANEARDASIVAAGADSMVRYFVYAARE